MPDVGPWGPKGSREPKGPHSLPLSGLGVGVWWILSGLVVVDRLLHISTSRLVVAPAGAVGVSVEHRRACAGGGAASL